MTATQALAAIVVSAIIPFIVQAIKTEAISGNAARWLALAASVASGVLVALVDGVPEDPESMVTCVFAMIGGIQAAYTLFKGVGVTSKWLDALLAMGSDGEGD